MSVLFTASKNLDPDLEEEQLKLTFPGDDDGDGTEMTTTSERQELVDDSEAEAWLPPKLSRKRILLLNSTWFGMQFMYLLLSVEVVPSQIRELVGDKAKGYIFGIVAATSSVLTFIASPLVGMLSDRIRSKFGKRRPVMVVGTAVLSIGFIGMVLIAGNINNDDKGCKRADKLGNESDVCIPLVKPVCPNDTDTGTFGIDGEVYRVVLYSIFFLIGTGSYAVLNVAYNGLMADMTHPSIRGFGSGVMGTMIVLGMLAGAGVGIFYKTIGVAGTFSIMYIVLVATVAITVLTTKEQVAKVKVHAPVKWKSVLLSYWGPLKDYNFRWVFITRFLMQMGVSTVMGFLQYWMADMVNLPKCLCPEAAVSMAMVPLLIGAALCSALGGYLSDRWHRRKPFVIGAAFIMCVGASILAAVPNYYVAIVVALVFGICYGFYESVDFALVMDVLPDHKDHAKDLAVWHQALVLPQLLATPVAGFILDGVQEAPLAGHPGKLGCSIGLGYIIVFLITAMYFLLSSLFVLKLRNIR